MSFFCSAVVFFFFYAPRMTSDWLCHFLSTPIVFSDEASTVSLKWGLIVFSLL